jgi:hypothetical protein
MAALDSSTFLVIIKQQRMGDSSPPAFRRDIPSPFCWHPAKAHKPGDVCRRAWPDTGSHIRLPVSGRSRCFTCDGCRRGRRSDLAQSPCPNPASAPPPCKGVKGRVIGVLPSERKYRSTQFRRELGALDQVGWAGGAVIQPDGQFEGLEQPGRYYAEICQFAPPAPSARTCLVRFLGSTTFTIGSEDLSGIEIQVDRDASEKQSS